MRAEVDATRTVLGTLEGPLQSRDPDLFTQVSTELDDLAATLDSLHDTHGVWPPLGELTQEQRQLVNGSVSQMAEDLAPIPTVLELPLSAN